MQVLAKDIYNLRKSLENVAAGEQSFDDLGDG